MTLLFIYRRSHTAIDGQVIHDAGPDLKLDPDKHSTLMSGVCRHGNADNAHLTCSWHNHQVRCRTMTCVRHEDHVWSLASRFLFDVDDDDSNDDDDNVCLPDWSDLSDWSGWCDLSYSGEPRVLQRTGSACV